jgi:hypothetical protein
VGHAIQEEVQGAPAEVQGAILEEVQGAPAEGRHVPEAGSGAAAARVAVDPA